MSRAELKAKCMKGLSEVGLVGTDEMAIQHGKNFYKYMFGHYPDLRKYFKGAENFTPEDVQNSERFAKQGQRILLGIRIIVDTYDDLATFKAYARETVNRHIKFKMDRNLWLAFFTVLIGHLKEQTTIDKETEEAWMKIGKEFADEAIKHSADLKLPN